MDINLEKNTERINGKTKKNKTNNPKNKKKIIIISSIVAILILAFAGSTSYIYTIISKYNNLIMPGVSVEGIDISGQTIEEAVKLISDKYEKEVSKRNIIIKAEDKQYTMGYSDINLKYNIKETVDAAYQYGRDLSSIEKFNAIRKPQSKKLDLQFTYNNEVISQKVSNIEKEVNREKKDATIKKNSSGGFVVTEEKVGLTLDKDTLVKDINSKIASTKEGNVEVTAVLNKDMPTKTKDLLSKVDTKVSTFSTSFVGSAASRATNITIGAQTVNGTLLMPGESFSFNKIVGNTTPDKGYQAGGAIVGDEIVDDYGGGICQVSSTLHNAVLRMGILPDQRRNHSMPVGYVQPGLDATIFYGGTDYVFTNSTQFPIYIEGYAASSKVTFNMYSNSSLVGKTYSFPNDVYETIKPNVKYVDDPKLEVGKEVVDKPGSNGYKVKVYRVVYDANGKEISREFMNDDYYKPYPKVIKRGTKPVQNNTEPPKTDKPTPDPNTPPPTPNPGGGSTTPSEGGN